MKLHPIDAYHYLSRSKALLRAKWLPLPGDATLVFILGVDIAILSFAAYSVVNAVVERSARHEVRQTAVLASYTRPLPPAPAKKKTSLLVDDFSQASANCLGGAWERSARYGGVLEEAVQTAADGSGNMLQLAYDVSSPSSLCSYVSELKDVDLSRYGRLRFQVKADADEVFKIELAGGETVKSVPISRLLPQGLTGEWQTVSLSLAGLAAAGSPVRLTFLFEHDQGMPYQGTILVRNIRLIGL